QGSTPPRSPPASPPPDGTPSAASVSIFASESGAIAGWNPGIPPQPIPPGGTKPPPSTVAEVGFQATDGAVYKGLALAQVGGQNFLFATDFHNGKIDVLDGSFHKVDLSNTPGFENFADPNLPPAYAPFTVPLITRNLY